MKISVYYILVFNFDSLKKFAPQFLLCKLLVESASHSCGSLMKKLHLMDCGVKAEMEMNSTCTCKKNSIKIYFLRSHSKALEKLVCLILIKIENKSCNNINSEACKLNHLFFGNRISNRDVWKSPLTLCVWVLREHLFTIRFRKRRFHP